MSHAHAELPSMLVSHTGPSSLTEIMGELVIPTSRSSHTLQNGFGIVTAIALHHNQTWLALCSGNTAWLIDVETGAILMTLVHPGHVTSASFSMNATQLATGCVDAIARIWDLTAGTMVQSLTHPDTVHGVHLHPTGEHLATGCQDGVARVFDLRTGTATQSCMAARQTPVRRVFLHESMRWLLTGGRGSLDLWDAQTGAHRSTLLPGKSLLVHGRSTQLGLIAGGCDETLALIWDARSGERLRAFEHPEKVTAVFLTPDSTRLATACGDSIARIWDI